MLTGQPLQKPPPDHSVKELAAVFLDRSCQQMLMYRDLPSLVFAASRDQSREAIRLVALPDGSEAWLGNALGLHQVGMVGVSQDTPDARPLLDFVQENVPLVELPWIDKTMRGEYLPARLARSRTDPTSS